MSFEIKAFLERASCGRKISDTGGSSSPFIFSGAKTRKISPIKSPNQCIPPPLGSIIWATKQIPPLPFSKKKIKQPKHRKKFVQRRLPRGGFPDRIKHRVSNPIQPRGDLGELLGDDGGGRGLRCGEGEALQYVAALVPLQRRRMSLD